MQFVTFAIRFLSWISNSLVYLRIYSSMDDDIDWWK